MVGGGGRPEQGEVERDLRERLDQLRSIPYTSLTEEPAGSDSSGVVLHNPDKAYRGYNLYCSRLGPEAYLIDMEGRVVHSWTYPQDEFWIWDHALLLENGDILVIEKYRFLLKLDWNSNLIWRKAMPVHHDILPLEDGTLMAIWLTLRSYRGLATRFSQITHLSGEGEVIDSWGTYENLDEIMSTFDRRSFLDTVLDSILAEGLSPRDIVNLDVPARTLRDGRVLYDYFHMNTLSVLPATPLARADRRFSEGNVLTCLRNVNQIAVLERGTWEILWVWGEGHLEWPHHPTMLANGNVLIFDNGVFRKYTRIIEVNPLTGEIEWEYKEDPPERFYSYGKGSAQRLPNGNTLICDGDNGRSVEVTRTGEKVWEWFNPATQDGRRVQVYRMMRIDPTLVERHLESS
jgi:hypothetical protein